MNNYIRYALIASLFMLISACDIEGLLGKNADTIDESSTDNKFDNTMNFNQTGNTYDSLKNYSGQDYTNQNQNYNNNPTYINNNPDKCEGALKYLQLVANPVSILDGAKQDIKNHCQIDAWRDDCMYIAQVMINSPYYEDIEYKYKLTNNNCVEINSRFYAKPDNTYDPSYGSTTTYGNTSSLPIGNNPTCQENYNRLGNYTDSYQIPEAFKSDLKYNCQFDSYHQYCLDILLKHQKISSQSWNEADRIYLENEMKNQNCWIDRNVGVQAENKLILDDVFLYVNYQGNLILNNSFEYGMEHWVTWNDDRNAYSANNYTEFMTGTSSLELSDAGGSCCSKRLFYTPEVIPAINNANMDIYNSYSPIWMPVQPGSEIKMEFYFKGTLSNAFILGKDRMGNWRNLTERGWVYEKEWAYTDLSVVIPMDIVAIGIQFDGGY